MCCKADTSLLLLMRRMSSSVVTSRTAKRLLGHSQMGMRPDRLRKPSGPLGVPLCWGASACRAAAVSEQHTSIHTAPSSSSVSSKSSSMQLPAVLAADPAGLMPNGSGTSAGTGASRSCCWLLPSVLPPSVLLPAAAAGCTAVKLPVSMPSLSASRMGGVSGTLLARLCHFLLLGLSDEAALTWPLRPCRMSSTLPAGLCWCWCAPCCASAGQQCCLLGPRGAAAAAALLRASRVTTRGFWNTRQAPPGTPLPGAAGTVLAAVAASASCSSLSSSALPVPAGWR